jgi:hypothetical protein
MKDTGIPHAMFNRHIISLAAMSEIQSRLPPSFTLAVRAHVGFDSFLEGSIADPSAPIRDAARKTATSLLRQHVEAHLLRRGLKEFTTSTSSAFYFPSGLVPNDKVPYVAASGRRTNKNVVGRSERNKVHWHLAMKINVVLGPPPIVRLKPYVCFSEDGTTALDDPKRTSARALAPGCDGPAEKGPANGPRNPGAVRAPIASAIAVVTTIAMPAGCARTRRTFGRRASLRPLRGSPCRHSHGHGPCAHRRRVSTGERPMHRGKAAWRPRRKAAPPPTSPRFIAARGCRVTGYRLRTPAPSGRKNCPERTGLLLGTERHWSHCGERQKLSRDPAPPAPSLVRGFGGGGAKGRFNPTRDPNHVFQEAAIK